jgi:hypothetical protein
MKSVVYELKSQMVAELTGCIIDATAEIRNDSSNYWFTSKEAENLTKERRWPLIAIIEISYCFNNSL